MLFNGSGQVPYKYTGTNWILLTILSRKHNWMVKNNGKNEVIKLDSLSQRTGLSRSLQFVHAYAPDMYASH